MLERGQIIREGLIREGRLIREEEDLGYLRLRSRCATKMDVSFKLLSVHSVRVPLIPFLNDVHQLNCKCLDCFQGVSKVISEQFLAGFKKFRYFLTLLSGVSFLVVVVRV